MFLHTTIVTNAIILAVMGLFLGFAFESALSIWSRIEKNGYSYSIRWAASSDYIEWFETICKSRERVPKIIIIKASAAFTISLLFGIASIMVATQIQSVTGEGDSTTLHLAISPQYARRFVDANSFSGWEASMAYGSKIKDAMALHINSTRNIPDANIGKIYKPKEYSYDVKCNKLNMKLQDKHSTNLYMDNGGCITGVIVMGGNFNFNSSASVKKVSDGRWSLVSPIETYPSYIPNIPADYSFGAATSNDSWPCAAFSGRSVLNINLMLGLTTNPKTTISKCVLPSGEIRVLSMTSVQFMSWGVHGTLDGIEMGFNIIQFKKSIKKSFREYDDLLQAMESKINAEDLKQNSTILIETKIYDSSMDLVVCIAERANYIKESDQPFMSIMCSYTTITIFTLKEQEVNMIIATARGDQSFTKYENMSTLMTVNHYIGYTNNKTTPVSMDTIRSANTEAAEYMAALGQNFYPDYNGSKLFVIYDAVDVVEGFYLPDWLSFLVVIVMFSSFLIWITTKFTLDDIYKDSLPALVLREIKLKSKSPDPFSTLKESYVHKDLNGNYLQFSGEDIVPVAIELESLQVIQMNNGPVERITQGNDNSDIEGTTQGRDDNSAVEETTQGKDGNSDVEETTQEKVNDDVENGIDNIDVEGTTQIVNNDVEDTIQIVNNDVEETTQGKANDTNRK
ncbi:hypothetical protein BGZ76_001627 [Entomortierella beljakovae]|nr:hypothetical protein BGZ76_001627 [Entomortierella beljakovae]